MGRTVTPDTLTTEYVDMVRKRGDLLETLGVGPLEKRTLEEELEISRSTIDRGIRELEALDLVEWTPAGFVRTTIGDLVTREYRSFEETIHTLVRFEPFMRHVPPGVIDVELLDGADLVVAEAGNPYAMIDRHVERLRNMDHCRVTLPITGLHAGEVSATQIVENGARGELVVCPAVADVHWNDPQFSQMVEEMLGTGRVDYYVYEGDLRFSLAIIDEFVQLVAVDGDEPRALIESAAEDLYGWAERTFEEYKQAATEVSATRLEPARQRETPG